MISVTVFISNVRTNNTLGKDIFDKGNLVIKYNCFLKYVKKKTVYNIGEGAVV